MTADDLRGWLPVAVDLRTGDPGVVLRHRGDRRLTAPFYDQDVPVTGPADPPDRRSSLGRLAGVLGADPPLAPTAFIFHTGRCGSTLVAQLLAADPANRVISEAPPLDVVLGAPRHRTVDPLEHRRWIRTTVGALGRPAPGESRLFVKLDSWSVVDAPVLRETFPDVPWLFVVRDPVEVLVSQLRFVPATLLPSVVPAELFGVPTAEAITWSRVRYAAHVQAVLLGRMLELVDEAHVVDHTELPGAVEPWLTGLGIEPDDDARRARHDRAARHAKTGAAYADDRSAKRAAAGDEVRAAVAELAAPRHRLLLSSRRIGGAAG